MKTTIEVSDDLLARSRAVARQEGTSLRALMEEGLRLALKARETRESEPFHMLTFGGDDEAAGRTPEFRDASWEPIRDEIYGERR